ncbi:hypothetical protein [Streptomyces decoyicus]|uniref:hypothetical protein n=1 Tax=Streptomyces decoyicus TaxID=249567 RepID=UPI0004AB56C6|nr:hypothetical protein [Streptomyces decoyicus]KOG41265.1 hypothetical protein ADK74_22290 [Streptomyces decoyicus]QZY20174.1 hypothetical protein K7C20_37320 [Streptomyces decoyicus]
MTDAARPRIVVHPPAPTGGRRVHVDAAILGVAYSVADLLEFLRRAGLGPDDVRLLDPLLIEWRGGGPEVWTTGTE